MKNTVYLEYFYRRDGGEALSSGRWADHADTHIDFSPRCVHIVDPTENRRHMTDGVIVNFVPKAGDTVWSVVARYQTGSTFGTIYGDYSIVGIYNDANKADDIRKAIENDYRCKTKEHGSFKPPHESPNYSGESWKGYFERLEGVEVDSLLVK
jgi:hypothetical protein